MTVNLKQCIRRAASGQEFTTTRFRQGGYTAVGLSRFAGARLRGKYAAAGESDGVGRAAEAAIPPRRVIVWRQIAGRCAAKRAASTRRRRAEATRGQRGDTPERFRV